MARYGLPDAGPTTILEWREDSSNLFLDNITNPSHDDFIAAGWLLYVVPVYGVHEKQGFLFFGAGTVTHTAIPWTQEEIDAETTAAADAVIEDAMEIELLSGAFIGVTVEDAQAYVDANVSDPGTAMVLRKVAKNLVALNELLRIKMGVE